MATDTAPVRKRYDPTRNIWQWPMFLIGAAVFAATWQGLIPTPQPNHGDEILANLTELRTSIEAASPDTTALKAQVQKLAADSEQYPEQAPFAHFVLGSGYVRLAESTAAPEQAREWWTLAAQHFDKTSPEKLPNEADDRPLFEYRSAKAHAGAGFPPGTSDGRLLLAIGELGRPKPPKGDYAGEAHRLRAELCLRVSPPDVKQAVESLEKYLAGAGLATPTASLARAKLRLSEILISINEVTQARGWLTQIGADAPPDVLLPAKAQLARIYMKEANWDEAAAQWEQLRNAPGVPAALQTQCAYHLGVCRQNQKQPDAAMKLFEEAAKSDGPESFAAVVKLADLTFRGPDAAARGAAATRLVNALKEPPTIAEYTLVPLNEVQATFEQAVQVLQTDGAFEAAMATAVAYEKIAAAGRAREKRAEVLVAWAETLQKQGGDFKSKFADAAKEFLAMAELPDLPASVRIDRFRRAVAFYKQAENRMAVRDTLAKLVKLPDLPDEVAGPVWAEYAECLLEGGMTAEAEKAFKQAVATSSMVGKYKLARLLIDSGDPKKQAFGMDLLKQIATAEEVKPNELEYRERTLLELGQDALKNGRFAEAENHFRKQINLHRNGSEANLGRFLLSVCLLQQYTRQANGTEKPEAAKMRQEALDLLQEIVADMDKRKASPAGLGERDGWLRTQASLRVLQALQQMDKPRDVIDAAGRVRFECVGRVEELIALSMMYHAWKQLNRPELALRVLEEMQTVYKSLPDSAYKAGNNSEYSKEYWDKVWFNPPGTDTTPPPPTTAPTPMPAPTPMSTAPASPMPVTPIGGPAPVEPLVPVPAAPTPPPTIQVPALPSP